MEFLIVAAAAMLYSLIAGAVIYGLLVTADRFTLLEKPWVYIVCGCIWPVAALPAVGYIAAGAAMGRKNGGIIDG